MHPNKRRREHGRWDDHHRSGSSSGRGDHYGEHQHGRPAANMSSRTSSSHRRPPLAWVPPSASTTTTNDTGCMQKGDNVPRRRVQQTPKIVTTTSLPSTHNNEEDYHADHPIGKVTPDLLLDDESQQSSSVTATMNKRKQREYEDDMIVPDIVVQAHHNATATSPMLHATTGAASYHFHTKRTKNKRETSIVEEGEIRLSPPSSPGVDQGGEKCSKDVVVVVPRRQSTHYSTSNSHDRKTMDRPTPTDVSPSSQKPARKRTTGRPQQPKPLAAVDPPKKKRKKKNGPTSVKNPKKVAPPPAHQRTSDGETRSQPRKKPKKTSSSGPVTSQGKGACRHAPKTKPIKVLKSQVQHTADRTACAPPHDDATHQGTTPKAGANKRRKQKQKSTSRTVAEQQPYDSSWVAASMLARHDSDSDTDDEELLVWAHTKLGVYIPDRVAVDRTRRRKLQRRRRARREAVAKERKKQAKPLTPAQVAAFLAADEVNNSSNNNNNNGCSQDGAGCWVRRSMRQPSRSALQAPGVKELIAKLGANDPDMVVLKMKKYCSDCDTPQIVIDSILDALEENTNCEALYIQNFNEGMRDDQMLHLLRILRSPRCKIWCLNIGETYNISTLMWERFARGLRKTKVTHMYASEHVISTELKDTIRETIRKNRQKHTMHCDPENLDTIVRCTHCWWNPINTKSLRPHVRKYEDILKDAEAQGLRGTKTGATLK